MIDSLNSLYFVIFIIIFYLWIVIFIAGRVSTRVNEFYIKIVGHISLTINKNKTVNQMFRIFPAGIISVLRSGTQSFINFMNPAAVYTAKFDEILEGKILFIAEAESYPALIIRKLYEGNFSTWLVYSSIVIVLFYFILTVF